MPPASSKKRSSTIVSCVGRQPSAAAAAPRYSTSCRAAGRADANLLGQPAARGLSRWIAAQTCGEIGAQARNRDRKLVGAARRLAEPEGNSRRLAMRVLDPDGPALDPLDAIRGVAELKHVALHALDREILIDRADDMVLRLQHNLVVGGVGNGAARGQRGRARAAPAAQHAVDGVAMDERGAAARRVAKPSASMRTTASKSSRVRLRKGHARRRRS